LGLLLFAFQAALGFSSGFLLFYSVAAFPAGGSLSLLLPVCVKLVVA
jgi:hypothetical protein